MNPAKHPPARSGQYRGRLVALAAGDDFAAAHQSHEAVEVSAVDHTPIVRAGLRIITVEFTDGLAQVAHELLLDLGPYEDVVRRGANVP